MNKFIKPLLLLIITNALAFGLLFFYRSPLNYNILILGGSVMALFCVTYLVIYFFRFGDEYLFLIVSMLLILGVLMQCRLNIEMGLKQILWYMLSVLAFYAAYFFFRYFKYASRLKYVYYIAGVLLFAATLAIGVARGGAKNWIIIGGRTVQPSEFIKILFVLFLSCYFCGKRDGYFFKIKEKYAVAGAVYVYLGFLVLQREWGLCLLFFIVYFIMEYVFEHDKRLMLLNLLLVGLGSALGYLTMYHIQVRVATWLDPWSDISNKGYQIAQSLFAIVSGGFFGSGIGLGKPDFIPEVHSDFIFSAICEEMGMFGGVALILLYFIFVYRGMKIAVALPDGFEKCVAVGITAMFGIQTFIIIGGVIKLIPLTGITLPFVSYGGSSLMSAFICIGILQAISAERFMRSGTEGGQQK